MKDQRLRKSVLMLLPNGFHPDPRVHREAKSLVENGFNVTIVAWDREARWPQSENCDGISVVRVAIKSTYGRGTQQLLYLLRFWLQAFLIASRMRFDILHCHDLITLPVGVMIAKIKHRKVIFDAHESYGEMLNGTVPGPLRRCISFLERILLRHIDLLVTVGSILERDYQLRGARRTRVIGNWKSVNDFKIGRKQLVAEKKRLGIGKEQIVISFLGYLHGDRKILPLVEAVKKSRDTFLILGGMGSQVDKIRNAIKGCENIKFIGRYGPEKIALYTSLSDVIYYVLDSKNPNAKYSAPNKLFEALAAGKAVLCGDHGEIAKIVREEQCGVILNSEDEQYLPTILSELATNGKLQTFKAKALAAGREKYNWAFAEKALLQSYHQLLSEAC